MRCFHCHTELDTTTAVPLDTPDWIRVSALACPTCSKITIIIPEIELGPLRDMARKKLGVSG